MNFYEPSFLIMASLADEPKHGYAMIEDIENMTGVRLGPGTLYGAISRLEQSGMIKALHTNDRRKPYCLTPLGEQTLKEQLNGFKKVTSIGLRRLGLS
jgi:DNA-binding PadR family transcriptional regulator